MLTVEHIDSTIIRQRDAGRIEVLDSNEHPVAWFGTWELAREFVNNRLALAGIRETLKLPSDVTLDDVMAAIQKLSVLGHYSLGVGASVILKLQNDVSRLAVEVELLKMKVGDAEQS